ncbi:acyl-CoA synthetase [Hydrogenophaga sp. PAMC20947]|uniref:acyl-CoA synthetase n=1 Tax=Hydrogenophaga sp. PAMC20947 TaxID=2565558 RepID=UPI00109D901A|nr:acyl-CoA synthetase [Hydrogenophaga sp. PAMC20947]QCB46084.1 acyl-CoA synthetase [Hydrogenophaga sp. PAMC20947]
MTAQPNSSQPLAETLAEPFAPVQPVRNATDVRALEQMPLAQRIQPRSTYELIRNSAAAFGAKTAFTFLPTAEPDAPAVRWSYAQLLQGVHQTANALHRLGLQAGDAVAVLLPGCLEYHLALWGGAAAGIVQPLNPLLSDEKLTALMNAAKARVLIAWGDEASEGEAGLWAKAQRIRHQVPSLQTVLRVAPHGEASAPALTDGNAAFQTLIAAEPDDHLVSGRLIAPTDIAAYFHTGGTTGAPKLARHSHGAQVFTAWACVQLQGVRVDDVAINGYPLFHVAGVLPGALTSLSAGAETVIPTNALFRNKAVIANFWKLVETHKVSVLSGVPTVLSALANVPVGDADTSSLRYGRTGAAPMPADLAARLKKLLGIQVHESLGMTEMAGISTITPPGMSAPPGCVGIRLPYTQWRIVALDEQGGASDRECAPGEAGMVLFKSPNLFSGFLDAHDNTKAFTHDGWLATGDLGFIDEQERLHLSGRSKDLIIRSGHNIDPKVIEDALAAHPAVQLCAAVGAPDAYAGELPVVFATLIPGATATEEELLAFVCAGVDEPPARPKRLTILETMPMTNVGKIYKPDLRVLAAAANSAKSAA